MFENISSAFSPFLPPSEFFYDKEMGSIGLKLTIECYNGEQNIGQIKIRSLQLRFRSEICGFIQMDSSF